MPLYFLFFISFVLFKCDVVITKSYVVPGFPASIETPWKKIHPYQINCHLTGGDEQGYPSGPHLVYFFDETKVVDQEEVSLCSVWEFVTTCYEHWYLSTDVTHVRRPVKVTLNECMSEIYDEKFSPSHLPDDSFPDPECYWLKTYETKKRIVHLQKIKVHFDYYTDSLVDHRLLKGRCNEIICPGISDNVLIVRDKEYSNHCTKWIPTQVKLSDNMMMATLTGIVYYVDKACDLNFCGRVGKRLTHGLFVAVPDKSAVKSLSRTRPCNRDNYTVAENVQVAKELTYEGDKEGYDIYQKCLGARDIIVTTGKVTPHLISQIAPMRGYYAVGEIYRHVNGSLEVSSGRYRTIEKFPDIAHKGCLIGDSEQKCFSFETWAFTESKPQKIPIEYRGRVTPLINGIVLLEHGDFFYPNSWKWVQLQNRELDQMEPAGIKHFVEDHPVFNQETSPDIKVIQTKKHFDIQDLFTGSWYRKLAWSAIFILVAVISIVIVYKIVRVVLKRRKSSGVEQIPLRELRNSPKAPSLVSRGVEF